MRRHRRRTRTCAASSRECGVRLDPERNARHAAVISADGPGCTVRVIATDEDLVIARHTRAVLAR
jgi:acetate kinase